MVPLLVFILLSGFLAQSPPEAEEPPVILISGTSTVRNWSCPGQATVDVASAKSAQPAPGFPGGVATLTIAVPVKSIDCENDEMNEHLRTALKEKTYPQILYRLVRYTMAGSDAVKAAGQLTIAGVTRPVSFDARLVPSPQGLRAVGETQIDMTQFAVTPPTLVMGQFKVGKVVRVRFNAVLQRPQQPSQ